MDAPTPAALALDAFVDRLLRGEALDPEVFLAAHPELSAADVARVRKLARVLGRGKPAEGGLPFERLGSYRLIERLGAGGMGLVYLAEDERLGRRVALKLVRPELATSERTLARFEREARAVAKLAHEHIVTVFEAGRIGDVSYLAMELVPGKSLDELYAEARLAQRPLDPRELLRWTRDVARALAAAHAAGIVHRDVKPSNLRITPERKALLLDFGLALDPDSATLSRSGEVQGTLYYVSPEQLEGRTPLDGRADVWSLGVTLYEGLTGHRPFDGASGEELIYQILSREPVAPRLFVPTLARDVETVVLKALEKERERRYASASELADELDALLEGRPVRARPTGPVTRAWKWSRRKPAHALAGALAALVLVGGPLSFAVVQGRHARALEQERDRADEQRRIAEERTVDLEQLTMFQADTIGAIQPFALAEDFLARLREALRARAGADEATTAADLAALERLLAGVPTTDVAAGALRAQVLEPAIRRAREDFTERPKLQGMLLLSVASTAWALGHAELALETQRTAHAVLVEHAPPDDRDRLVSAANLGQYLQAAGLLDEAEPLVREAAEGLARLHGDDDERTLAARHNLAILLHSLGQAEAALELEEAVLARRRARLGDDSPDTLSSLSALGGLYYVVGRHDEAAPLMEEAYRRRAATLGAGHESTLASANNLAVLYRKLGRQAEAGKVLREALEGARAELGEAHRTTSLAQANVAELLADAGQLAEAATLLRESAANLARSSGPHHADTLLVLAKLARILRDLGQGPESLDELEPVRAAAAAELGPAAPPLRGLGLALVRTLREVGDTETALARVREVLPVLVAELGVDDRTTQQWLAAELLTLTLEGRHAEAAAAHAAARPSAPIDELARALDGLFAAWPASDPARAAALEAAGR